MPKDYSMSVNLVNKQALAPLLTLIVLTSPTLDEMRDANQHANQFLLSIYGDNHANPTIPRRTNRPTDRIVLGRIEKNIAIRVHQQDAARRVDGTAAESQRYAQ